MYRRRFRLCFYWMSPDGESHVGNGWGCLRWCGHRPCRAILRHLDTLFCWESDSVHPFLILFILGRPAFAPPTTSSSWLRRHFASRTGRFSSHCNGFSQRRGADARVAAGCFSRPRKYSDRIIRCVIERCKRGWKIILKKLKKYLEMSVRNAYLCTRNQEMVLDCRGSLKNHFEKIVPEFGKLKKRS